MSLRFVVLAAGLGKRMKSALPKVLHSCMFRPMLWHVLTAAIGMDGAADPAGDGRHILVLGHRHEFVSSWLEATPFAGYFNAVIQEPQLGTGHAIMMCKAALSGCRDDLLIMPADVPLITSRLLDDFYSDFLSKKSDLSVLTTILPDPAGFGRILRDPAPSGGRIARIIEEGDADDETRKIREINSGIYCVRAAPLLEFLSRITSDNAQGEFYLTDMIKIFREEGLSVDGSSCADHMRVMGVNSRFELSLVQARMQVEINRGLMQNGVTLEDPRSTFVDPAARFESDVLLRPFTIIEGACEIESGAVVGPDTHISNVKLGKNSHVSHSVLKDSVVCENVSIGPYSHLRPGNLLMNNTKVGNFVELKKSTLGENSKASHLSYLGDATIGENTNIGAGTITCNFDGENKNPTRIGNNVFIGSDSILVAPLQIGDGAYTAAGSVITRDLPPDSLGIGRARQETKPDWARKKREGK